MNTFRLKVYHRMLPLPLRAALFLTLSMPAVLAAEIGNDYPTQARAEFVFACMASNGQTQQALRQCACAIDVIASILPVRKV